MPGYVVIGKSGRQWETIYRELTCQSPYESADFCPL
ncbi:hypothetical protein YSA_08888 [Pseudomonas putida ND6]|uniref:Uncharacterized protein n=1 Tax=Pseudomonas putida ND6 TaxID=231023 RepID=I3V1F3_PSEPU|nr:hypothetical protein YSA_08888 [Pseudomonas putida ND6]